MTRNAKEKYPRSFVQPLPLRPYHMEMPVPTKRKRNQPDAPRLQTRKQNQTTKPAVKAGLAKEEKQKRRTKEQIDADEQVAKAQQAAEKKDRQERLERVAEIEDQNFIEDQVCTAVGAA